MNRKSVISTVSINFTLATILCLLTVPTAGCKTKAQTGAGLGAGIGALVGQAIGGDTGSTLIGAAVGTGIGYIIGNEKDKKAAKAHDYDAPTPLSGTKWTVVNLVMKDKPQYLRITVEFRKDGKVVTTRYEPGGTKVIMEERYRIVGNTLIIHRTDYIINAGYKIYGKELHIECERFKAVLHRI